MPPFDVACRRRQHRSVVAPRTAACRNSRLTPVAANGAAAFAHYRRHPEGDGWRALRSTSSTSPTTASGRSSASSSPSCSQCSPFPTASTPSRPRSHPDRRMKASIPSRTRPGRTRTRRSPAAPCSRYRCRDGRRLPPCRGRPVSRSVRRRCVRRAEERVRPTSPPRSFPCVWSPVRRRQRAGGAPHVPVDQADDCDDVLRGQPRTVDRSEAGVVAGEDVRPEHGSRCRHVEQPLVLAVQRPRRAGQSVDVAPPASGGRRWAAGTDRPVDHQLEKFGLAGHVGVDRHRDQPDGLGQTTHRHGTQSLGVGDGDRDGDDALDVDSLTWPAPVRRRVAPEQRRRRARPQKRRRRSPTGVRCHDRPAIARRRP